MLGAIDEDEEEEFSDPVSNECSDLAASSGPKPPAATSHTILVVDNSGSMKLRDVANGSSELLQRCKALVSSLSKDLFAEQALLSAGACTDLVSCVRMEDGLTRLLCELLPLNQARVSLLARNAPGSSLLCAPRGEGFYAPALAEAVRLAELGASVLDPTACTTVLFFSDGRPSDKPCDIPGAGAWVCARCTWRNAADELQCVSCASSRLDEYGGDHERWQRTRLLPHLAAQLEELCALLDYDKRRLQWHSIGLGKEEECRTAQHDRGPAARHWPLQLLHARRAVPRPRRIERLFVADAVAPSLLDYQVPPPVARRLSEPVRGPLHAIPSR